MFNRTAPCSTCPFRTGGNALRYLGCDRAVEIAESLAERDQTFTCHGDLGVPRHDRQHCVGAAILLEKMDRPNQMMRIGERLGMYDPDAWMIHEDEVFDSFEEFIEAQDDA